MNPAVKFLIVVLGMIYLLRRVVQVVMMKSIQKKHGR